jgi:hypothetical protein
MGNIRVLFNGNRGSVQRVNRPGSKGDIPVPDTAGVNSASTCQYLLTSRCLIQHIKTYIFVVICTLLEDVSYFEIRCIETFQYSV